MTTLTILLAACQAAGVVTPSGAQPGNSAVTQPAPNGGSEPTRLDGTITYALDGTNSGGGSSTETHQHLSANVHLAVQDADHPFTFIDAGSTFTFTETTRTDDAQTSSMCGLHQQSSGAGSGQFGPTGKIVASYPDNSPEVDLIMKVPYSSDYSSTFLCNGLTQSGTSDEVTDGLTCNTGGTGSLAGTIEPGGVMKIAPGQVIDFTCTETSPIGSGATKVTGKLTSS